LKYTSYFVFEIYNSEYKNDTEYKIYGGACWNYGGTERNYNW